MRQKACAPGVVRKHPLTFCLTFIIRKSRSAKFVVKGHGKVIHKGQCLSLILLQTVQQIFTLVLLLASTQTREWGRVFILFFRTRLEDRRIALFVLFNGVGV
jgi:hypothetical protein